MLTLVVAIRAYTSLNNCFNSDDFYLQENIINSTVDRINFDVITGWVNVEFHEGSEIEIRLYDKFRSFNRIDKRTIQSSIILNKTVVNINSESPAFNFYTCQHAYIEILIPISYPTPIAISGAVKTGYVTIHGTNGISLASIDIVVEAGKVEIDEVAAKSIFVSSDLGCLSVKHSIASSDIKLLVNTGSIRTKDIITKDLQAVARYGRSVHKDIVADKVHVETKWGYSTVKDSSPLSSKQNLDVITEYGNNIVLIGSPKINFNIGTKRGYMVVDYENDLWNCKVHNSSLNILNGECATIEKSAHDQYSHISLKSTYGISNLVVDSFEDD
jgi:hypothetical protein